ncbi:exonuclease SbcCD subunit D [Streptomyces sp. SM10]|uniref:metallophosphoesterase family protein n=1 Tax=Streptomyces sp. SM10 TaxID=565556 RepID=UPI0015E18E1F|nr:exonuclease SbcCD subunit D [Streptomyces sp. SM10]
MSRTLHTSDWHVGHTLYGHPREEDFDAVLAEIADVAREYRPDLIIHSGDLFHSSRLTAADLLRAMGALHELADVAPTVVVAGNHDSPGYLKFLNLVSGPSRGKGLFFVDRLRPAREGGVLSFDACGGEQRIRLAAMPFVHPNRFWRSSSTSGMTPADYAEGMRGLQAELVEALREGYDPSRDVLLFTSHVYVTGATRSASERAVHEAFEFPAEDLPDVSYVALGHIHRPQIVPGIEFPARYAGSPLPMDFGEATDSKSVVIVDADPGRQAKALPRPLSSGRRLAYFPGTLDELRAQASQYDGTFLKADITGEEPGTLLTREVAEIVPNAILVGPVRAREETADAVLDEAPGDEPDLPDAFRAYLTREGMSNAAAEPTVSAFTQLLNEIDDETPSPTPAEEQLRIALSDTWTETS